MKTSSKLVALAMSKSSLYRLQKSANRITCQSGSIWITQDNNVQDIVLERGESFTHVGTDGVLLYALEPAALLVHQDPSSSSPANSFWLSHYGNTSEVLQ